MAIHTAQMEAHGPRSRRSGAKGVADWWCALGTLARELRGHWWPLGIIVVVLLCDALLVGLDLAFRYAVLDGTELPNWFNLSQERGLGELFEHMVIAGGSAALLFTMWGGRSWRLLTVAIALLLVGLDNALEFHERGGRWFATKFLGDPSIGAAQVAEIGFLALLALVILAALIHVWRGGPSVINASALTILLFLACAGFFGVAVDALHAMIPTGTLIEVALGGIEDGGELLFFTLAGALALASAVLRHESSAR